MKAIRKLGKAALQSILKLLAERFNIFVVKGNLSRAYRVDPHRAIRGDWITGLDVVRNAMVELLSAEIRARNLPGAVAEVGVYQGEFAQIINDYFPDRTLYLFDTFEGFNARDAEVDRKLGYSPAAWDFSKTSIELVMSKMRDKTRVVIKKGCFPESADGVEEERFCFVSLDADLYQPTYSGLQWFYPRLVEGGYIMINDYNSDFYTGVRKAVVSFAVETSISYMPIPDMCGSLIIAKPLTLKQSSPDL